MTGKIRRGVHISLTQMANVEIIPDRPCTLHILVNGKAKGHLTFDTVIQAKLMEIMPGGFMRIYVEEKEKQ